MGLRGAFLLLVSLTGTAIQASTEVCFSPNDACDQKLLSFVESATSSIDIAIYDINLDELVHALLKKATKIPVRIIVDRRQSKGTHSLVPTLLSAKDKVAGLKLELKYGHQRGIMHNKFTIVDGKEIETGSFNYTNHATKANNENQIYTDDQQVVTKYVRQFESIWGKGDEAVPLKGKLKHSSADSNHSGFKF